MASLAQIGEPEATVSIEDQIVRPAQRAVGAFGVQHLDAAGGQVHPLDAPT